jgi:Tfp pilus assembly protein PilV
MADERMHSACRGSRLRALRRGDAGFALIEVVVSAALVMVIAAAVLGGVDVPSVLAGENQAGSQAASLAQQDQERMRAMPVAQLVNYSPPPRTVELDGREYTVESRVTWVTDSGSTVTCASTDTTSGDYLRLSSTVDGPGQKRPVTIDSLLTPPNGSDASKKGNLAVHITDQVGDPVPNIDVSIPGKAGATDENGCVFFGLLNTGQYQVTISEAGYVDKGGNQTVVRTETVSVGNTTVAEQSYARAASIRVDVQANVYGTVKASTIRSSTPTTNGVTLSNSQMPPSGTKMFTPAVAGATFLTAQSLYPFTDGYTAYSGRCSTANPVPIMGPFSATPPPGGSATVVVRQAALNMSVTIPSNFPPVQTPEVTLDNKVSGCPDFANVSLTAAGTLTDSGFPGGTYDVCVDGRVANGNGPAAHYHVDAGSNPTQLANVTLDEYQTGTPLNLVVANMTAEQGPCAPPVS